MEVNISTESDDNDTENADLSQPMEFSQTSPSTTGETHEFKSR